MKIYLAGGGQKERIMNIYLAGEHPIKNGNKAQTWQGCNILETFYYARSNKNFPRLISSCDNFLLDSGAFSFMQQKNAKCDWERYVEEYAEFINRHNVRHFFELDIESIIGIKEVERLRTLLEKRTGKKPIPVWHKERGKQYFVDMCKEYNYVAIGGLVKRGGGNADEEKFFPWFIQTAHKNGAMIHGLGYTKVEKLKKYNFDSVDSTAWLYGNRSGNIYIFNPAKGNFTKIAKSGHRLDSFKAAENNFKEWVKFCKYAELYL